MLRRLQNGLKLLMVTAGHIRTPVFIYFPDKAGNDAIRKAFDQQCVDDNWTTSAYNEVFLVDNWSESHILYNYLWLVYVWFVVTSINPNIISIQERLAR